MRQREWCRDGSRSYKVATGGADKRVRLWRLDLHPSERPLMYAVVICRTQAVLSPVHPYPPFSVLPLIQFFLSVSLSIHLISPPVCVSLHLYNNAALPNE